MKKCNKKNKKKLKDEKLETIKKQFDEFKFQDKDGNDNKENIKGRLLAYIPYAGRLSQYYGNLNQKYLSLSISFFAVIGFFLTFYLIHLNFNLFQGLPIILGTVIIYDFHILHIYPYHVSRQCSE